MTDDRGALPVASHLADRPAAEPTRDWLGEETIEPTGEFTDLLDMGQPAQAANLVTVEWALWGKDEAQTAYHILRCSNGALSADVFRDVITRYGIGVKPSLPQYTVCWVPDERGEPDYLAIGIHELAESEQQQAGRRRNVAGRVVEYVRLFCVKYHDLAGRGASYGALLAAVSPYLLPPDSVDSLRIELPDDKSPELTAADRQLAQDVTRLLLTGNPVGVLGAEHVAAAIRLAFFDEVLSNLPYGMRAVFSASTWVSPTVQDLRFRLFFSDVPRPKDNRTEYVKWGEPGQLRPPAGKGGAAELYWDWLCGAPAGALAGLSEMTEPARFTDADISHLVASLPADKPINSTLEELIAHLRKGDQEGVATNIKRLNRAVASRRLAVDRGLVRHFVLQQRLFGEHEWLNSSTKKSLYSTLLRLAFDQPITYAAYCDIEAAAGGRPGLELRQVLFSLENDVFTYVLVVKGGTEISDPALWGRLPAVGYPPTRLLDAVERNLSQLREPHCKLMFDFAVNYLCAAAEAPKEELIRRGYLTALVERAFPGNQRAQESRLEQILAFVYDGQLTRAQVVEVFEQPALAPTRALETAVARWTSRKHKMVIEQQALLARLRNKGMLEEAERVSRQFRSKETGLLPVPLRRPSGPPEPRLIPRPTIVIGIGLGFGLVLISVLVFLALSHLLSAY